MKIIFFGTSKFGKIILERLISSAYKPIFVVTMPDKPVGRSRELTPSAVKSVVLKHETWNIEIAQPKKFDEGFRLQVSGLKPALFIVAAYGKLIPKEILSIPQSGALNVHPSLLPKYRGPSPIQYAIWNGDKETGVTIIQMDSEMDHGDIVSSIKYQVSRSATSEHLSEELAKIGAKLLIDTLPKWVAGEIKPVPQIHKNATYTKILAKEDGHIDWRKSAEEIERQLRAFSPWPGLFTFWKNKRIKILKGRVFETPTPAEEAKPGIVARAQERGELLVQTGEGLFLIETLQPEGKNEMTAKEFINGHPEIQGDELI